MPQTNENKSCMRFDESWEARVCIRVFSTLCPGQTRTRVAWKLMRVEKREFAWVFSTFMLQTNENKSYMKVDECWEARVGMSVEKREFVWEFSQLSCSTQTRTRVAWAKTLVIFHQHLNQFKVDESAWEFAVKRGRELRLSSTLIPVWSRLSPASSRDIPHCPSREDSTELIFQIVQLYRFLFQVSCRTIKTGWKCTSWKFCECDGLFLGYCTVHIVVCREHSYGGKMIHPECLSRLQ
jgi:hypothetical protein